ncbi:hypothetical protein AB0M57_25350 [Streptomyces sp. NPDC051597]|uniref:hypothetical protein n=1 Tax=Streptomyces sp. NPDC051597 TaxID=3155049 RepID=UPI00344ADD18
MIGDERIGYALTVQVHGFAAVVVAAVAGDDRLRLCVPRVVEVDVSTDQQQPLRVVYLGPAKAWTPPRRAAGETEPEFVDSLGEARGVEAGGLVVRAGFVDAPICSRVEHTDPRAATPARSDLRAEQLGPLNYPFGLFRSISRAPGIPVQGSAGCDIQSTVRD